MFSIKKTPAFDRQPIAWTHKLADYNGGSTLSSSELAQNIVYEGTPVGLDSTGLLHVIKTAKLSASASNSATTYTVFKGHNFKVGDVIMAKTASKAYTITAIATNSEDATSDDITVGTTLGTALAEGSIIYQAASEVASTSALKYAPLGLLDASYDIETLGNQMVAVVTIGQIRESNIKSGVGDLIKSLLPTIKFI